MKMRKYLAWLLVFAFIFSLVTGNTAQVMAKSRKVAAIKSVYVKDRKEKSNEKDLYNEAGREEKN